MSQSNRHLGARHRFGLTTPHGLFPGAYTCLSMQDTGAGMDATTLSRAMEPFYTTKEPGRGTGLGLSMVRELAIQAGGCLVLTSEIDKGALAELWLPLSEAVADIESGSSKNVNNHAAEIGG